MADVQHKATRDFEVAGHAIAAGTAVLLQLSSVHRSESAFPNSREFRPERFLDVDGLALNRQEMEKVASDHSDLVCRTRNRFTVNTPISPLLLLLLPFLTTGNRRGRIGVRNVFMLYSNTSLFRQPTKQHFQVIPFGLGRRLCLGESLARAELFLVLVSVLQRFSLSTVGAPSLEPTGKLLLRPRPYRLLVQERPDIG